MLVSWFSEKQTNLICCIWHFSYSHRIILGVVQLMVSRGMNKKWPRLGWSHKIRWIELCLYIWTAFASLRNFQNWSPFSFCFNGLSELSLLYIPCPRTQSTPNPQQAHLQLATICMPQIAVPLLSLNEVIFLNLPQFASLFRLTSAVKFLKETDIVMPTEENKPRRLGAVSALFSQH